MTYLLQALVLAVLLASPALANGSHHRSSATTREFQHLHPCPSTGHSTGPCPGYVKDHVKPLACGGADLPANMQWQTTAAGKAKDKWERRGC